jgi:hypothetical protein
VEDISSNHFKASQLAVLAMNVTILFQLTVGVFGSRAQFVSVQTLGHMERFLSSPCRELGTDGILNAAPRDLCGHWGVRGNHEKVANRQGA